MTPLLALALAVAPDANELSRLEQCTKLAVADAGKAITAAQAWQAEGGGVSARQCLGHAYMGAGRGAPAALVFQQAARAAETARDPRVADLWAQAGNAWLAAGEAAKARTALDTALARGGGSDPWKGEIYIDRARSDVSLGEMDAARVDLDKALALVPGDPFGWLLSATLARRQNDIVRAAKDIAEAERRAPDDADVALEAGNIAAMQGDIATAKAKWGDAAKRGAGTGTGKAAEDALKAN